MSDSKIGVKIDGIGHLISDSRLTVPPYQRSYAWKDEHVTELLGDLSAAYRRYPSEYFLGSVVVSTKSLSGTLVGEIIDGQQRLATISIIIATMRDAMIDHNDPRADNLEQGFLVRSDYKHPQGVRYLQLNERDDRFFKEAIIYSCKKRPRHYPPTTESHKRLLSAQAKARSFVNDVINQSGGTSELLKWLSFIEESVRVIVVSVIDDNSAFLIFETLNDRGLELSAIDLLKNYLFSRAARVDQTSQLSEAQEIWLELLRYLDPLGGEHAVMQYIRSMWTAYSGEIARANVYVLIRKHFDSPNVRNSATSVRDFLKLAADNADNYCSIVKPNDMKQKFCEFKDYFLIMSSIKSSDAHIPFLLSIMTRSEINNYDLSAIFRQLISFCTRQAVTSDVTSAHQIVSLSKRVLFKEIDSVALIVDELGKCIVNDSLFEDRLITSSIGNIALIKYMLSSIERFRSRYLAYEVFDIKTEAHVVQHDYVLPWKAGFGWDGFTPEEVSVNAAKFGNQIILESDIYNSCRNSRNTMSFHDKKLLLARSNFEMTKEIAKEPIWTQIQIEDRQKELAKICCKIWKARSLDELRESQT